MMNYNDINRTIRTETKDATKDLKKEYRKLKMKHVPSASNTYPLTSIFNKFKQQHGLINRIGFKFKRSGVFVHKGVGRGTKIHEVGNTKRKPKPWFNPVMEKFSNQLTSDIADQHLQLISEKITIK